MIYFYIAMHKPECETRPLAREYEKLRFDTVPHPVLNLPRQTVA